MSSKASARPEQINLASLPRDELFTRARAAGRESLGDAEALQPFADQMFLNWVNVHMPSSAGQTEDEFGKLVDAAHDEFFVGLNEGVVTYLCAQKVGSGPDVIEQFDALLSDESMKAWRIFNVLAFMAAGLDDDRAGELPVRCAVTELRDDVEKLASSIMNLAWKVRRG
ncbi:hypothetical protein [Paraburkholderia tropica]|uniref:Uncharacterized protein n=1 Tax=Paraburkholderia tropica TaxID=92647 RepID=A0AAQ1JW08_9BURK|nr:hypothetical protein [Paraburkholderia tropica]RQN35029.1 hypothetical protein EHZ25_31875 [Paraburkholderia tropica]SEK02761.1 hypothetical protein SAMN05216550_113211 [Paraburkholderia tropica]